MLTGNCIKATYSRDIQYYDDPYLLHRVFRPQKIPMFDERKPTTKIKARRTPITAETRGTIMAQPTHTPDKPEESEKLEDLERMPPVEEIPKEKSRGRNRVAKTQRHHEKTRMT
ncbi:hypothetical protein THARTR1_05724 [Trichoderma harzianum]|uniref:Uncharacterized protein n=1 Tax=Trichoderma harzianum TaxID=5544 RepID=A0A2K0U806_TRIHA|nr:hypothetical protein THARTR1_05724 [Trichoderma harzianum]